MGGRKSTVPPEALEEILKLLHARKTPTQIADALNLAGVKRTNGKRFERSHIRTIIDGPRSKPPDEGPPPGSPSSESRSLTPEEKEEDVEVVEAEPVNGDRWRPRKIDVDPASLALPRSPPGVTTQTKREARIEDAEKLVDEAIRDFQEAEPEDRGPALVRVLQCLRVYDSMLVSAERQEATHTKVAQAIFIINHGRGGGPDLPAGLPDPTPGDDPLPSVFVEVVKTYIEELEGDWDVVLERLRNKEDD